MYSTSALVHSKVYVAMTTARTEAMSSNVQRRQSAPQNSFASIPFQVLQHCNVYIFYYADFNTHDRYLRAIGDKGSRLGSVAHVAETLQ